ncbi:MAG: recombinase family protein [candidate division WWE3 bacterium]|nr:recombinase family protein [candidate division WWE3 bacterium]
MNYCTTPNPISKDFVEVISELESSRLNDPLFLESLSQPYSLRVAIYLRVSTKDQATEDKVSLDIQESECNSYLKQFSSYVIAGTYCDGGKSGGTMVGRDEFNKMIADAKAGNIDVLLAWSTDRLARNVDEMTQLRAELRKINVQVTTTKEPAEIIDPRKLTLEGNETMQKILAYVQDWSAECDKRKISERFRIGKIGKAEKGLIPVKTPYGFRKSVKYINNDPKQKIEEDVTVPDEICVVKDIFNYYDTNSWGIRKIVDELNLKGIKSPKGGIWCYSSVKYTLQNPTYCGLVRYGWRLSKSKISRARLQQGHKGIIVKGKHQAVINPEQFKRVQDKLKRRAELGGKAVHSKGLLTGILKCGRCGGSAYLCSYHHWLAYEKNKKDRTKYTKGSAYMCGNYSQHGKTVCSQRYILSQGKIEEAVVKQIRELANSKETQEEFIKQMKKNRVKDIKQELVMLNKTKEDLLIRKDRLKAAYLAGTIQLEEYEQDRRKLEERIKNLENKCAETQEELLREADAERHSRDAILALANFDEIWEKSEFMHKKELLQTLLEKVTIVGGVVNISFRNC